MSLGDFNNCITLQELVCAQKKLLWRLYDIPKKWVARLKNCSGCLPYELPPWGKLVPRAENILYSKSFRTYIYILAVYFRLKMFLLFCKRLLGNCMAPLKSGMRALKFAWVVYHTSFTPCENWFRYKKITTYDKSFLVLIAV